MNIFDLLEAEMINRLGYKWTTKDGEKIAIKDMSDTHLRNLYKYLVRNMIRIKDDLSAQTDEFEQATDYFLGYDDERSDFSIIRFREDPDWELNTKDRIAQDED